MSILHVDLYNFTSQVAQSWQSASRPCAESFWEHFLGIGAYCNKLSA